MSKYYVCVNCGQVVQGWNASQQIECCENPNYVRGGGPEENGWTEADVEEFFRSTGPDEN